MSMVVANSTNTSIEEETSGAELRRGPWTLEEDTLLTNYIAAHGEGRWNVSAKCAGLRRTGKSCRLRWLNYLKPDIKRGNLTPHEQILILELHSKWGNRWSKIAQHLPGRTDNEIKNYWRTRVQKQARQLKIDSDSNKFIEAVKRFWMPRLVIDKIDHTSSLMCSPSSSSSSSSSKPSPNDPLPSLTPNQENSGIHEMGKPENSKQENACTCLATDDDSRSVYEEAGFGNFATSAFDISMLESQLACDDWFGVEVADSLWSIDESRQAAEEVGGEWVLS